MNPIKFSGLFRLNLQSNRSSEALSEPQKENALKALADLLQNQRGIVFKKLNNDLFQTIEPTEHYSPSNPEPKNVTVEYNPYHNSPEKLDAIQNKDKVLSDFPIKRYGGTTFLLHSGELRLPQNWYQIHYPWDPTLTRKVKDHLQQITACRHEVDRRLYIQEHCNDLPSEIKTGWLRLCSDSQYFLKTYQTLSYDNL